MDIHVYDTSFSRIAIVDSVQSLLWLEKYDATGKFEIYTKFSEDLLSLFQEDYYIRIPRQTNKTMIVEGISIKTAVETGNILVVYGRSLESLLDRRIILQQTIIDGSLQTGIQTLLNENIISSSQPNRNISNFVFSASTNPTILALTLQAQYDSEGLYDTIADLCSLNSIGFRILLNSSNQFVFSLYIGTDRSYAQSTNPYVVFSPSFDNLNNSDYYKTKEFFKNYALLFGDPGVSGLPNTVRIEYYSSGHSTTYTGINRRETFLDLSSVSRYEDGVEIPSSEYDPQIRQVAAQLVKRDYSILSSFTGESDINSTNYKYGVDFFLGDIVQFENEYGMTARSRIKEVMISEDTSGVKVTPIFEAI